MTVSTTKHLIWLLVCLTAVKTGAQSLAEDLRAIETSYGLLRDYSFSYCIYKATAPEKCEPLVFQKCGDQFYYESQEDLMVANAKEMLILNQVGHYAYYSQRGNEKTITLSDQINGIIQVAKRVNLISSFQGIKMYEIEVMNHELSTIMISVHTELNVIEELDYRFVDTKMNFRIRRKAHLQYCDRALPYSIDDIMSRNAKGELVLSGEFSTYTLIDSTIN
jgi:hypothetical protein